MSSKKIKIRGIGDVEVTKDFYDNVTGVFAEKGFTNPQMCSVLGIRHNTFHNFSNLKLGVSKKMADFAKLGSDYIFANFGSDYYFNNGKICFEKISTPVDIQFHFRGVYYGYLQKPHSNELEYFVMSFKPPTDIRDKDGKVRMWSDEINATGVLILNKSTYSIDLSATIDRNNKAFFIGKKCEDANLKYLITTWRDRHHQVYSVICMILHIPVPNHFTKWEDIYANKTKIREDIIKNTPQIVSSFFKNAKNKFIHLDTTHL